MPPSKVMCLVCRLYSQATVPLRKIARFDKSIAEGVHLVPRRNLFSKELLGINQFHRMQIQSMDYIGPLQGKIQQEMEEYLKAEENAVFSQDIKSMMHVCTTREQLDTILQMLLRYQQQLTPSEQECIFHFGPILMRLMHSMNLIDLAWQVFQDRRFSWLFNISTPRYILGDLLFQSDRHSLVLQLHTASLPENNDNNTTLCHSFLRTLALASCLKLNTPASLEYAEMVMRQSKDASMVRGIYFLTLLAINQSDWRVAEEYFTLHEVPTSPTISYFNLKAVLLSGLRKSSKVLSHLRSVLEAEDPGFVNEGCFVFEATFERCRECIDRSESESNRKELDAIEAELKKEGLLVRADLSEYIMRPIIPKRRLQDGFKSRSRANQHSSHSDDFRRKDKPYTNQTKFLDNFSDE